METRAISFQVSGRVQGVGFRYAARNQAVKLGLTGWVRNCSDGDVQGFVQGNELSVQVFVDWLWQGPDYARVANVKCAEAMHQKYDDFSIVI